MKVITRDFVCCACSFVAISLRLICKYIQRIITNVRDIHKPTTDQALRNEKVQWEEKETKSKK
jgi:hypothetical protein